MLEMNENAEIFMDAMSENTAAAAQTERIVFDEAFTLHHRTVFRAARSVVRDSGLAEDVTQEVFLRLHRNLDSIDNLEMLRPWLIRVALNVAKNSLRTKFRANTREENYVKENEDAGVHSVETDFEKRETLGEVNRALNKIKEPLRSCLILRQQGLSYREIAESLSLNETSIGQFVARGRKEFVRFYGKIGRDV
ncbi:MAG: sigma-70 family RNA polymerase sigma factor [Acidobacteria bacterium]|nr:sigma-70 family RNA polymerase sigma factor [Acidobacteriota bacterium]MBK8151535.1 sigma-70 family RNA polymerase sigma factor [Acidobacteriota bacterium]MBK8812597.1 sigma-70 family RNA polymerase sigma factor [Acidobacteriota bacterium]